MVRGAPSGDGANTLGDNNDRSHWEREEEMEEEDDDEDEEDKEACWASISRRACSRMERMASSDPPPAPLDEDGGRDVSAVRWGSKAG